MCPLRPTPECSPELTAEAQWGGSWAGCEEGVPGAGRGPVGQSGGEVPSPAAVTQTEGGALSSCQRPAGVWAGDTQRLGGSRSPGERPFLGPEFNASSTGPGPVYWVEGHLPDDSGLSTLVPLIAGTFVAEPHPALGLLLEQISHEEGQSPPADGLLLHATGAWWDSLGRELRYRLGMRGKVARARPQGWGRAHGSEPRVPGLWEDGDRTQRRCWAGPPSSRGHVGLVAVRSPRG